MSLLQIIDDIVRPPRHFGSAIWDPVDRYFLRYPVGYLNPIRTIAPLDTGEGLSVKDGHFQANVDVQQFSPNEINVKVTGDNTVTIEGKHEEKPDEHGYISRQFIRRYVLPKDCDISKVESKLSSDGVLTITAPKASGDAEEHRSIPITQTGQPSRPIEHKKEEGKKSKL